MNVRDCAQIQSGLGTGESEVLPLFEAERCSQLDSSLALLDGGPFGKFNSSTVSLEGEPPWSPREGANAEAYALVTSVE